MDESQNSNLSGILLTVQDVLGVLVPGAMFLLFAKNGLKSNLFSEKHLFFNSLIELDGTIKWIYFAIVSYASGLLISYICHNEFWFQGVIDKRVLSKEKKKFVKENKVLIAEAFAVCEKVVGKKLLGNRKEDVLRWMPIVIRFCSFNALAHWARLHAIRIFARHMVFVFYFGGLITIFSHDLLSALVIVAMSYLMLRYYFSISTHSHEIGMKLLVIDHRSGDV